jgi:hypothetical protein
LKLFFIIVLIQKLELDIKYLSIFSIILLDSAYIIWGHPMEVSRGRAFPIRQAKLPAPALTFDSDMHESTECPTPPACLQRIQLRAAYSFIELIIEIQIAGIGIET